MIDPVAFAEARLDEDEAAAKDAEPFYAGRDLTAELVEEGFDPEVGQHAERHDPARALREVEAGRRILARHGGNHWCPDPQDRDWTVYEAGERVTLTYPCGDLRDLLCRWADHPEYEESWKP